MDDDDVVVVGVQAEEAISSALIAGRAAGDGPAGIGRRASARAASVSPSQSGCGTTTRLSTPGGGHRPQAADQDRLARQADELLGRVAAEAVAGASGQDDGVRPTHGA